MLPFRVYTNALAQLSAKLSTAAISILLVGILTRYLSLEWYGLYSEIFNYLSIFSVLADMGLYTVAIRELSRTDDPSEKQKIRSNILALRLSLGAVMMVIALAAAWIFPAFRSWVALIWLWVIALFTLLGLLESSLRSFLQADMDTEFSFFSTSAGKLLTLWLTYVIAWWWLPVVALWESRDTLWLISVLISALCGNLLMAVMLTLYARKRWSISFSWDAAYLKNLVIATLPYALALFLNVIFFKVDIILLTFLLPAEEAHKAVALYSVPMKIVEVGMMLGTLIMNSVLPILSWHYARGEIGALQKITLRTTLILGGLWILALWIGSLFWRLILSLIADPQYIAANLVPNSLSALSVVIWIFPLFFLSSVATFVLVAAGRQSALLISNSVIAAVNIIGNILFIPSMSFMGSAYVTVISQALLVVSAWYLALRVIIHKK